MLVLGLNTTVLNADKPLAIVEQVTEDVIETFTGSIFDVTPLTYVAEEGYTNNIIEVVNTVTDEQEFAIDEMGNSDGTGTIVDIADDVFRYTSLTPITISVRLGSALIVVIS